MKLEIYQCDKCGAECGSYYDRVAVNFPYGEQHDLCIKCAREIFPKKNDDHGGVE
jgi:hypothetical protein